MPLNALHAHALAALAHEPRNAPEWQVRGAHEETAQRIAVRRQFAAHLLFGRPLGDAAQLWTRNWAHLTAVQAALENR
ncbi:hypothetical protein IHN63_03265 [Deinococcus sp. 6YEL10]|uniref:hypothetical protein n=1 Tax=Deinococcus sp. 6YEL10 TaxID=2745870 RepID=UPI001E59D31C|nr:hypothetical protein [Deinococcus sp. 6YEL10]MCD0160320.1 hypothetical protein [Deinococcus sp. 6YEL10]